MLRYANPSASSTSPPPCCPGCGWRRPADSPASIRRYSWCRPTTSRATRCGSCMSMCRRPGMAASMASCSSPASSASSGSIRWLTRRQGGGPPDQGDVHRRLPDHRLAVGAADVGTYWIWDARSPRCWCCCSYLGYLGVWAAIGTRAKGGAGGSRALRRRVVNIPIIRFSVEW